MTSPTHPSGARRSKKNATNMDLSQPFKNNFLTPNYNISPIKTKFSSTSDLNPEKSFENNKSHTQKSLDQRHINQQEMQQQQQQHFFHKDTKRDYFNDNIDEFLFYKKYSVQNLKLSKASNETRSSSMDHARSALPERTELKYAVDFERLNSSRLLPEKQKARGISFSLNTNASKMLSSPHKTSISASTASKQPAKSVDRETFEKIKHSHNSKEKLNMDKCINSKRWNSAELRKERLKSLMSRWKGVHSCIIPAVREDSFTFTEFIDGPFDDADNNVCEWSGLSKKKSLNFSFPSINTDVSSTPEAITVSNKISLDNLGPSSGIKKSAYLQKVKLIDTKAQTEFDDLHQNHDKKMEWRQDSKSKRRDFGKALLERNKRHSSLNSNNVPNSFDSIATENDASGSSSRCGATTTSIESTATNASSDSTSDSKSYKLHQMRDDSGYKSLETQQSLKRLEAGENGPLQKTSQMFKFVAQKFNKTSSVTKSFETLKSAVTLTENPEAIRSESLEERNIKPDGKTADSVQDKSSAYTLEKPSFLSKRASILFGFQGKKYENVTIIESNSNKNVASNKEQVGKSNESKESVIKNVTGLKSEAEKKIYPNEVSNEEIFKNEEKYMEKIKPKNYPQAMDIFSVRQQSTANSQKDAQGPTSKTFNRSSTFNPEEKQMNKSFFVSRFTLMLQKAEVLMNSFSEDPLFERCHNSNNDPNLSSNVHTTFPLPSSTIPFTSNSTPTISLKSRWKMAAKLVGDSWSKANSLPETVEQMSKNSFRSNSDSNEVGSSELKPFTKPLTEQVQQAVSISTTESSNTPTIPTSLRLQRILEQQKASRNQSSLIKKSLKDAKPSKAKIPLSPLLGENFQSHLTQNPQRPQQFFHSHLQPPAFPSMQESTYLNEETIKASNILQPYIGSPSHKPKQSPNTMPPFINSFLQTSPPQKAPVSQISSFKRGDAKTASKRRKAYRTRKQLNEKLFPDDDDTSTFFQTTQKSTIQQKSSLKAIPSSSSFSKPSITFSTSISANEDSNTSVTTNEDLFELTFIRQASGRMVYRDYSVDAKTEAIFNEFIQYDPQLEASRHRESFLTERDSKKRKKSGS